MTTLTDIKSTDERNETEAAKLFGVELSNEMTEANTFYNGSDEYYAQAWHTKCGQVLVVSGDNNTFNAALRDADFDWPHDPYNEMSNYKAIAAAAGI